MFSPAETAWSEGCTVLSDAETRSAGAVLAAIGGESVENSLADAALVVQNAQLSLQSAQEALFICHFRLF